MTDQELSLRHRIMVAFAETGAPPALGPAEEPLLRRLADQHVVVLDDGAIRMAHPFAAHREGASVTAGGRTWWGNCAWDAYGIAAALDLPRPVIASGALTAGPGIAFHVAVPARHWWDDIGFT